MRQSREVQPNDRPAARFRKHMRIGALYRRKIVCQRDERYNIERRIERQRPAFALHFIEQEIFIGNGYAHMPASARKLLRFDGLAIEFISNLHGEGQCVMRFALITDVLRIRMEMVNVSLLRRRFVGKNVLDVRQTGGVLNGFPSVRIDNIHAGENGLRLPRRGCGHINRFAALQIRGIRLCKRRNRQYRHQQRKSKARRTFENSRSHTGHPIIADRMPAAPPASISTASTTQRIRTLFFMKPSPLVQLFRALQRLYHIDRAHLLTHHQIDNL